MRRVLFVCMGNICRSPTAEAVARRRAELAGLDDCFIFDSADTHGYHIGDAPDQRAIDAGKRRGYDLTSLSARNVSASDFERFDWVLAMDNDNLAHLAAMCPQQYRHRLMLLLELAPQSKLREVPDPYYGNADGFNTVVDVIEEGITGLLAQPK